MSFMEAEPGALNVVNGRAFPLNSTIKKYGKPAFAEFIGTFTMVTFGICSVSSAALTGSLLGLGQVSFVWGFAVGLSIYATASISGAHLNPAVTLSMLLFKHISVKKAMLYILAQFSGAIMAGFVNLAIYQPFINSKAGVPFMFGEYYPNPSINKNGVYISPVRAMLVEAFGTALLTFFIFALTDKCNTATDKRFVPFLIGFCVATIIDILAPITQAGLNPARDFGPRFAAIVAGWDTSVAMEGWWVYIVGPILGSPVGAAVHKFMLSRDIDECGDHEKCE